MQSLYVEADSILHRMAPGVKLGGLVIFSLAVFFTANLWGLAGFAAVAAFAYFTLPIRLRPALARLVPMALAVLLVARCLPAPDADVLILGLLGRRCWGVAGASDSTEVDMQRCLRACLDKALASVHSNTATALSCLAITCVFLLSL